MLYCDFLYNNIIYRKLPKKCCTYNNFQVLSTYGTKLHKSRICKANIYLVFRILITKQRKLMDKVKKIALRNSPIFRNISDSDFDKIINIALASYYDYDKGDIILGQTAGTGRIGIVTKGKIIGIKYHYDGSSQIMKLYTKGDIIGLNAAASQSTTGADTFEADSECSVVFLWYRNIVDSNYLSSDCKLTVLKNVAKVLADENIDSTHAIDILSHYTIRDRIFAFFSIQKESHTAETFDISMSQVQLAQYLRVNRSVLSKELNAMKKEGIIDFKGSVYTIRNSAE